MRSFIVVFPHDRAPVPQLALWTMHVNWDTRTFIRVMPDTTRNEIVQTFIAHSSHWSDVLYLIENREYDLHMLNSLFKAPLYMEEQKSGVQVMGTEDAKTLVIRRDALDQMEKHGIRDKWFDLIFNFIEAARRCKCKVAVYDEEEMKRQHDEMVASGDSPGGIRLEEEKENVSNQAD